MDFVCLVHSHRLQTMLSAPQSRDGGRTPNRPSAGLTFAELPAPRTALQDPLPCVGWTAAADPSVSHQIAGFLSCILSMLARPRTGGEPEEGTSAVRRAHQPDGEGRPLRLR